MRVFLTVLMFTGQCGGHRQQSQVEVKAVRGYPADGSLGIRHTQNLELISIHEGKWADENTNLKNYLGYFITKINDVDMSNHEEFITFKNGCEAGDSIIFTLQNPDIHEVEVVAKKSYSENEPWGVDFNIDQVVIGVVDGSWAAKHTNLQEFKGCTLLKVNGENISSKADLLAAKRNCADKDNVVFSLRKDKKDEYFKEKGKEELLKQEKLLAQLQGKQGEEFKQQGFHLARKLKNRIHNREIKTQAELDELKNSNEVLLKRLEENIKDKELQLHQELLTDQKEHFQEKVKPPSKYFKGDQITFRLGSDQKNFIVTERLEFVTVHDGTDGFIEQVDMTHSEPRYQISTWDNFQKPVSLRSVPEVLVRRKEYFQEEVKKDLLEQEKIFAEFQAKQDEEFKQQEARLAKKLQKRIQKRGIKTQTDLDGLKKSNEALLKTLQEKNMELQLHKDKLNVLELAIGSDVKLIGLKIEEMNGLCATIKEGPVFSRGVERYIVDIQDSPQVGNLSDAVRSRVRGNKKLRFKKENLEPLVINTE